MPVTFGEHAILLVEDEDFSRSIVSQMLRKMGFGSVLTAAGAREAVELLSQHRVTIILTDFRMPEMHGLQLLKAIRTGRTPASRDLPCAMLTSYTERHLVGLAIVLDVDTFLAKPVSVDVLTKHLGRILQYRFEPQPVTMYDAVDVDNAAPHITGVMAPTRVAPEPEEELKPLPLDENDAPPPPRPESTGPDFGPAKPKIVKMRLSDVPEDAVLARDMVGTGGTLLLSAGTPFKRRYVRRLEELKAFKETVNDVWIIEPSGAE